ncbi:helix-turn-helix domain-containing protein [Streptomyces xanthophaeus]
MSRRAGSWGSTGRRATGGGRGKASTTGLPPESSRSGRYLSLLERRRIASLREGGLAVREIAGLLGRAPSTVSGSGATVVLMTSADTTPTWPTIAAASGPDARDVPSWPRSAEPRWCGYAVGARGVCRWRT